MIIENFGKGVFNQYVIGLASVGPGLDSLKGLVLASNSSTSLPFGWRRCAVVLHLHTSAVRLDVSTAAA